MATRSIQITQKRQFDFSHIVAGTSQVLTVLERVNVARYMWGTLQVAVHQADSSGGSIAFDLYGDGHSFEDPGLAFATVAPLFPSTVLPAQGPAFLSYSGRVFGEGVVVRAVATKTSGSPLTANVSITLVLQDYDFRPSDIPGLVLWVDMREPTSYVVTPGGAPAVTSITNLVSGAPWTEAANPPLFRSAGLNGRPCMDFDGTTQKIVSTEAAVANAMGAGLASTVFYAANLDLAGPQGLAVLGGGVATGTNLRNIRYWGASFSGVGVFTAGGIDSGGASSAVTAPSDTNIDVSEWLHTGTAMSLSINGGAPNPNGAAYSSASTSPTRSALGCIPTVTPQGFWDGKVGEVLLYSRALAADERAAVRRYLGVKWAIAVS